MNLAPYRDERPPAREVLPDGSVLLSVPVASAHSVTFGVWLRSGSRDEPPELGGSSHFIEHMVFKGSESRSALEIAAAFDGLGAVVDAFTTKDHVGFSVRVLPEYCAAAVEMLSDMLLRPAFDPAMIALEKDVVLEEIQESLDTPEDRLHDAFAARVYGAHPRGRPVLGTPAAVESFDAAKLRGAHRRLFAGPNVVLALAGCLKPSFRELVIDRFRPPPGDTVTAAKTPPETADEAERPAGSRLELHSPIIQSYFEIGNRGVSYLHEDRLAVDFLANVLGGGMSSRVFQAVREREGLAYTVYNYTDMGRDVGLVSCAGSCSPRKEARLEEVVRAEYARIIAEGVADEELESNRAQFKSQLIFSLEGVVNQMVRAVRDELIYGRFVPLTELVDRIDAIDAAALQRCAEIYFAPENLTVATHGPGR